MQDIIVLLLNAQTVSERESEREIQERDRVHCKSVAKGLREASPGDLLAIV